MSEKCHNRTMRSFDYVVGTGEKFLSRLFTALNLLPSMATLAVAK